MKNELPLRILNLIQAADDAMPRAYAPYSQFRVGAALRTTDGRIFTGVNVENQSFGLTCCAERNAIFQAVAAGIHNFEAMALTVCGSRSVTPCGACRQVMSEFVPDLTLYLCCTDSDDVTITTLSDLFPDGFVLY